MRNANSHREMLIGLSFGALAVGLAYLGISCVQYADAQDLSLAVATEEAHLQHMAAEGSMVEQSVLDTVQTLREERLGLLIDSGYYWFFGGLIIGALGASIPASRKLLEISEQD